MRRKENAKRNMVQAIIYFFNERKGSAIKIKRLEESVKLLIALHEQLMVSEERFTRGISGLTEDRHQHRKTLIEMAMIISGGMVAFAEQFKKKQLLPAVHYPYSKLNRANDNELVSMCRLIMKDARQIKKLKEFGIVDERMEQLDKQIKIFEEKAPKYKGAKREKAAQHAEMKKLVNKMCRILKYSIDKMMATLKDDKETEYGLYMIVRKVVCYGRKRKVKLRKAINKLTGEVMRDVMVNIVEEAETLVNDFAQEELQQPGKRTIKIELKGFKPLILELDDIEQAKNIEPVLEPEDILDNVRKLNVVI